MHIGGHTKRALLALLAAAALPLGGCGQPAPSDAPAAEYEAGQIPGVEKPASRDARAARSFDCTVTAVSDGDTFRCRETEADGRPIRVRLSGVAARERDGSCSPGHPCPEASAEAATRELAALADGRRLDCRQVGDTYGRRAAFCSREDGVDLSCAMVESGTTVVWQRHWGNHRCDARGAA
ncbi:MAG TPA: thermonuclease family protein [Allosphingosinicella sp.]|jgi:endonuclease YncB( thermonuclease family)|nr:thermonuclease family protein [Allosphingosinicella sp.]